MHSFSTYIDEALGLRRNVSLNPVLWDGDRLRPEVRTTLLNFAEAWREFAKIPEDRVIDVIMVGGNAGLFYNESSDIDVHLLVDKQTLGFGPLSEDFLKDRKALWTARHDVRVKGYQVEPYAQGIDEGYATGQGVYSLERDEWIQRPTQEEYDPETDSSLSRRVSHWQRSIDKLVGGDAGVEASSVLKNKLAEMRSRSIRRDGELGRDNLLFKALRMSGYIDKLNEYAKKKRAEELSLY